MYFFNLYKTIHTINWSPPLLNLIELNFREAGDGELDVHLLNEDTGEEIPINLSNNGDKTYTVDYEPPQSGNYCVTLDYGGLRVPTTPIKFKVEPSVDVSKIKVDGLEPSK